MCNFSERYGGRWLQSIQSVQYTEEEKSYWWGAACRIKDSRHRGLGGWRGDLWKMKCLKEIACVSWSLGHVFHKCDKTKLRSWGNYCSCLHRWMSSHGISPSSAHFLSLAPLSIAFTLSLILKIDWKTKNTQAECRTPYIKTRLIINTNKISFFGMFIVSLCTKCCSVLILLHKQRKKLQQKKE